MHNDKTKRNKKTQTQTKNKNKNKQTNKQTNKNTHNIKQEIFKVLNFYFAIEQLCNKKIFSQVMYLGKFFALS